MISLESAERALKDVYLGVLSDQINNRIDPLWAKIKKTTSDVYGNEIRKIPCWAWKYDSNEELKYPIFSMKLDTIKSEIEISDKAIRGCEKSAGAFVNLINSEMENLIKRSGVEIKNRLYSNTKSLDFQGLEEIFSNSMFCNGLNREMYEELQPRIAYWSGYPAPYQIQELIDNHNDEINLMICSPAFKRKYIEERLIREPLEYTEIGGLKYLLYNNYLPMITYPDIEDNVIYLINTNDFEIKELCDWEWLTNDSGKVLRQHPTLPKYQATLVKYCNLVCESPYKQIKIVIEK